MGRKNVIIAAAAVVILTMAAVGVAYAYTASISNTDNTVTNTFFTMEVDDPDYRSTFSQDIEYDTHTAPGPVNTYSPVSGSADGYVKLGDDLVIDITRSEGNDDTFAVILTPSVSGLTVHAGGPASVSEKVSGTFAVGYRCATSDGHTADEDIQYTDEVRIPMATTAVVTGSSAVLDSTQIPKAFDADDVHVIDDRSVTRVVVSLYLKVEGYSEQPRFSDVDIAFKAVSDVFEATVTALDGESDALEGAQVTLSNNRYRVAAFTDAQGEAVILLPAGTYDGLIQGEMVRQTSACSFTGLVIETDDVEREVTDLVRLYEISLTLNGGQDSWLGGYVYQYQLSYEGSEAIVFGPAGTLKTVIRAAAGETVTVTKLSGQYDYTILAPGKTSGDADPNVSEEITAGQTDLAFTIADKLEASVGALVAGEDGTIEITSPSGTKSNVVMLSSDPSVVRVLSASEGTVKAVSQGDATIHIEAKIGGVQYYLDLEVSVGA